MSERLAAVILLLTSLSGAAAIVNGTTVPPGSPLAHSMVSLQWNGRHKCGGVLIDRLTILTVAHCYPLTFVDPSRPELVTAVIGSVNLSSPNALRVGVRPIPLWPERFPPRLRTSLVMDASFREASYDYMLLKLLRPVPQQRTIRYAQPAAAPTRGSVCQALGFGRYKYPDNVGADKRRNDFTNSLQVASVTPVDPSECFRGEPAPHTFLCLKQTYEQERPVGGVPCFGDSGGPLLCRMAGTDQLYLSGLIEAGMVPCNVAESPFLFMSISAVGEWIANNMECPE